MAMRAATAPITAGRVSTTSETGPGLAARPQAPSGYGSASRAARTAPTPTSRDSGETGPDHDGRTRPADADEPVCNRRAGGPFRPVGAPEPAAGAADRWPFWWPVRRPGRPAPRRPGR